MSTIIIRPKSRSGNATEQESNLDTGILLSQLLIRHPLPIGQDITSDDQTMISNSQIVLPAPLSIGYDFLGDWEDKIWGPMDRMYDYGELRP